MRAGEDAAAWTAARAASRVRVTQQGTNQYAENMEVDRMNRAAEWAAAENGGYDAVVGSDDTSADAQAEKIAQMRAASNRAGLGTTGGGGGFQFPSFELPSLPEFPAPAPAPQFSAPAPAPQFSAPAPAASASDDGPFAFLAELFGMTTTTTTTTPPPSPLESFLQGLGLR
jgi:hypothetical protein